MKKSSKVLIIVLVLLIGVILYMMFTPAKIEEQEQVNVEMEDVTKWIDNLAGEDGNEVIVSHEKKDVEVNLVTEDLLAQDIVILELNESDVFMEAWQDFIDSYELLSAVMSVDLPGYFLTIRDNNGDILGVFHNGDTLMNRFE